MRSTLCQALFVAALCTTAHAQGPSHGVPTKLVAAIDEWKGASYRIELAADGAIYYSDNTSGRLRRTRIRVPAERWVAFRKHLDAARVWSWRAQYIDLAVVDGVGWELQVAYRDRSTASRGSNAHPPKRQFEQFLAAVRELTEGKPFE